MRGRFLPVLSILSIFGVLFMVNFTTPPEVGVIGVLVFFTTSYLFFLGLAALGCRLFFMIRGKINKAKASTNLSKKSLRYGLVVALAPVALMLVGSFGGISIGEVVIVVFLEILLCFLTSRNVI